MTQDAWTRWIVERFDLGYRTLHALDAPAAQVGPALCLELRRSRRNRQLPDGTTVRRGDPIGILHLNNRRILALHHGSPGQRTVGLLFRRRVLALLEVLAALAAPGARGAYQGAWAMVFALASGSALAIAGPLRGEIGWGGAWAAFGGLTLGAGAAFAAARARLTRLAEARAGRS